MSGDTFGSGRGPCHPAHKHPTDENGNPVPDYSCRYCCPVCATYAPVRKGDR